MSAPLSLGSLAEILAAGAALWAAVIASRAALDWKNGIERQRNDECIAAVSNCAAAIGRVIRRKQMFTEENRSETIQAVWDKWSAFRTSCEVARTYNPDLPLDLYDKGEKIINDMEDACLKPSLLTIDADKINSDFGKVQYKVKSILSTLYRERLRTGLARKISRLD